MKRQILLIAIFLLITTAPQMLSMNIFKAVDENQIERVKKIIEEDPSTVNAKNHAGDIPLYRAIKKGCAEIVKLFIDKGAKVNVKRRTSKNHLLDLAASYGHVEIVKLLIDKGARINAKNRDRLGEVPLHSAARYGHIEVVKLLIDKGANINAQDNYKNGPADKALRHDRKETAELLTKLELLNKLAKNNNKGKIEKEVANWISDEKTSAWLKIKAIEALIRVWKRNKSSLGFSDLKTCIKKMSFNDLSLKSSTLLNFAYYKNGIRDMNGRTIKEALCLYPTVEAIPLIFSSKPNVKYIKELRGQAKTLNRKKFGHNLSKTEYIVAMLNRTKKLPFPPEIVGRIISFTSGKFN